MVRVEQVEISDDELDAMDEEDLTALAQAVREAGRVTPYLLATPVVSILIGWGLMGDVLTPQILTGSAITMLGVGVVALAERGLRAGAAKA